MKYDFYATFPLHDESRNILCKKQWKYTKNIHLNLKLSKKVP